MLKPAFDLGTVVATPAAIEFLNFNAADLAVLLLRHQTGDCGDMEPDDVLANLTAIISGGRIFSSYSIGSQKVWVITEADRSVTTVLLPEDN
jgi:hypothetical protein